MRTFQVWHIVAAHVAVYAISVPAGAQQPSPNVPPPQLELLEEGEEPTITIQQSGPRQQISEKRAPGGRITEIKVTSGNSTYYLKPDDPAGGPGNSVRTAQWEILRFDLRTPNETVEAAASTPLPPPPPPSTTDAPAAK
jgi:hypothetical protein